MTNQTADNKLFLVSYDHDGDLIQLPQECAHLFKQGEYYGHCKYYDYDEWHGIELSSEYINEDGDKGKSVFKVIPVEEIHDRISLECLERDSTHPVYYYDPETNTLNHQGWFPISNSCSLVDTLADFLGDEIPSLYEGEDFYQEIL